MTLIKMVSSNADIRAEFNIHSPEDLIHMMKFEPAKFRYICQIISADDLVEDAISYVAPGWAGKIASGAYRFIKNWWNGSSSTSVPDKPVAVLPDPIAAGQTEGIKQIQVEHIEPTRMIGNTRTVTIPTTAELSPGYVDTEYLASTVHPEDGPNRMPSYSNKCTAMGHATI